METPISLNTISELPQFI